MTSKKAFHTLTISVLLFTSLVGCLPAHGQQEFSVFEERAWRFMVDILMLDLSRYEVVSSTRLTPPTELSFPPHIVNLYYVFKAFGSSANGSLRVSITFTNGSLTHCSIDFSELPLLSADIPKDVLGSLERAKLILNRYMTFFGAKDVKPMLEMLDEVKDLRNYTKIEGNMKFTVHCEVDADTREIGLVDIRLSHWENNIEFQRKSLGLLFTSTEWTFWDTWNLYRVGSAELKVSEDEAVRIAKEAVKTYTYTAADYEGKTVVVGNFTVLDKPLYVDLSADCRGDSYTLYPFWEVYLCLDTMYLGGVTGLRVLIWADTGEVAGIYPTGGLGPPAPQTNGEETSNGELALNMKTTVLLVAIAAIVAILAIAIIKTAKKKQALH